MSVCTILMEATNFESCCREKADETANTESFAQDQKRLGSRLIKFKDGFQYFLSKDDCSRKLCLFRNKQSHYHCDQAGCNFSTIGNVKAHLRFHSNPNNMNVKMYTHHYKTSECIVSGCPFNKTSHYHCRKCENVSKYKHSAEKHCLSHITEEAKKDWKSSTHQYKPEAGVEEKKVSVAQRKRDSEEMPSVANIPAETLPPSLHRRNKCKTTAQSTITGVSVTEIINGKPLHVQLSSEDKLLEECAFCLHDTSTIRQLRTILYLNNYFEVSGLRSFEGVVDHFFNSMKQELKAFYKTPSTITEDIRDFMRKSSCVSKAKEYFLEVALTFWNLLETLD